jgi:hypothetical protein
LAVEGDWREAPFWIWTRENPLRRRLFVRQLSDEMILTDRQYWEARLPLAPGKDGRRAVEQLLDLRRQGVKIRGRAFITTLWARLALGDLFLHGIGGGNYDRVTDRIIERFFRRPPPGYLILSATLFLPIASTNEKLEDPAAVDRRLRELTYHPERQLKGIFPTAVVPHDMNELVAAKQLWIDTPATRDNAKVRCQAIRKINEQLQPPLADIRRNLIERRERAIEQERIKKFLQWREYGFCLYPEDALREFFEMLLPKK